ncbi:DUF4124 domain-containing protein [Ramlibacter sp. USB13]|uniref:DUF4124 domain-containing protein n=1 Tax=Ramlibacter cellulosilyticus TaxID=2764187 RepID=A0A923MMH0_9BURK|nr:DUF4124 domain-containing protein [Ramlibacter cellulosilyticus]MBC5781755.1 DUF4124 domain-containing protein [Ramlibacter cellulosilyticus]
MVPDALRIALLLLVAMPAAAQGVFRCQDAAGKVAYQSQPCAVGSRESQLRLRNDAPEAPTQPRVSQWKGFTPPRVAAITFYYDPAEEPVGFSSERMEADIRAAMAAWSAGCDVRLAYGGRRPARLPATPDHVPIRWAPEYMQLAHPADGRSGIAGTGSLTSGIALKPRFHESNMLSVLVHEMGHVLGLPHNHDDRQSVMSYLRDDALRRNPQPSAGDLRDCNESMKTLFGIEYRAPVDAPPPRVGPRMTDGEALERLRGSRRP